MTVLGPGDHRTEGGLAFRIIGEGEPLLLLHGLMVSGAMFEPLEPLLSDRFRLIIPDLRGHGESGELPGPYDVPGLAADIPALIAEAGCERVAVLGYSHGGAVAQQLTHTHPALVSRQLLTCTYACNVATPRERLEASVLTAMLAVWGPATIARLVVRAMKPTVAGPVRMTEAQAAWLRRIMGENRSGPMRGAARGLVTFDSRPWLGELRAPTLVIGGADDTAVPRHHFDTLVQGIPGAAGRLVDRAGHTLIWTHTQELATIVRGT
jgi:pimeloyl-ACP methyl ester carboxylesterase